MSEKTVSLALQGGGSHGAFTWGVLDKLLEDGRIGIEAISGASAGAMNALVLAHGLTAGGREGARAALKDFWDSVAGGAAFNFVPEDFSAIENNGASSRPHPAFQAFLSLTRFFSPYQLNPFDLNPLRDILAKSIDFERIRSACRIKLFIAATQVSTGRLKLFRTRQISLDVALASACLPSLHHAVQIDGEAYWDGGLSANPPLFPLVHQCATNDVLVVLLHPLRRPEIPTGADDIWHRLAEISFSSTFFTELQGLALAKKEAERWPLALGRVERRLRRLSLHLVDAQDLTSQLSAVSKLNTDRSFIGALFEQGRKRAETWLAENYAHIGARSSFRLASLLR